MAFLTLMVVPRNSSKGKVLDPSRGNVFYNTWNYQVAIGKNEPPTIAGVVSDFYQILKLLKELEYPYLVMPDHVPSHPDPANSKQGFAFAYGYIKAILQVLNEG